MFGKRCSLCGGKLNSRGICTECGLDNSKSDKNYPDKTGVIVTECRLHMYMRRKKNTDRTGKQITGK